MEDGGNQLSLLVLAAGIGSRFGGLKQLESFGDNGETLMEYSLRNAQAAGFNRFVFVIRRDFADDFRGAVLDRLPAGVRTDIVFQETDILPPGFHLPAGRTKPWGTGHAVWVAKGALTGPFGVINADDFYGREAFAKLAAYLSGDEERDSEIAVIAFELGKTLSIHGGVSRGVLSTAGGYLEGLEEYHELVREGAVVAGIGSLKGDRKSLPLKTPVSLNLFGFRGNALSELEADIVQFFEQEASSPKSEYYLPSYVDLVRKAGRKVAVLTTEDEWMGVTYREDLEAVRERIAKLMMEGRIGATQGGQAGEQS